MRRHPPPKPRKTKFAKILPGYYRLVETEKFGHPVYVWITVRNPGPWKIANIFYYIDKEGEYKSARTLKDAKKYAMSRKDFEKKYGHLLNTTNESKKDLYLK